VRTRMFACVRACMHASEHSCVRACVRAYEGACVRYGGRRRDAAGAGLYLVLNGTRNVVQVLRYVVSVDFQAQQRHSIGSMCRADGV
jgi:hypothetical protein